MEGAGAGAFGGPPGSTAGAIIGALAGGLSALLAVAEQENCQDIEYIVFILYYPFVSFCVVMDMEVQESKI